jgi:general secretion pathway protein G
MKIEIEKKNENRLSNKRRRLALRGFSLIEMMIVLALIGLIMAGIGIYVMNSLAKGQVSAARSQAYEISKQLDLYRLEFGHYPSGSEGFDALVSPPRGEPYMDKVPVDPWGNEFMYIYPGEKNRKKPDIRSKGDDGIENTEDDVGNWAADS